VRIRFEIQLEDVLCRARLSIAIGGACRHCVLLLFL
jgi:hypothetical protein